jgi:hypothetical protein
MTSVQHNTIIYCTIHHKLCHHPPTTAWVLSTTMTASGWHVQHRTLLHNTVHYSSVCRLLVGGWRPDGCSLGPVSNSMSYRRRPAGEPHACRRRSNGGSLTEAAHTRQHIAPEQHSRIRAVLCMGAWTTQSDPSCVVHGCLDNTVGSELCCAWVLGQHSRIRAVLCMGAWTTQSGPSCVVSACVQCPIHQQTARMPPSAVIGSSMSRPRVAIWLADGPPTDRTEVEVVITVDRRTHVVAL